MGFLEAVGQFKFLQQALIAGVVVATLCSVLSVYVVLKRMAFIGQGISHAAFGGIALGLVISDRLSSPEAWRNIVTAVFCVGVGMLIAGASRRGKLSADSAIGIFLAVSMALGVILISLRHQYTADLMTYLFGSILAITVGDVWAAAILAILVLVFVALLYKELLYYSFDEEMAAASGIPVGALHYLLVGVLALTIVVSVKIVGVVLVSAFLVIPGAAGKLLGLRFGPMMAAAVGVGVVSTVAGLYASHVMQVPSGAAIVAVQFIVFLAIMIAMRGRR
jgi:zinc transport system permease protein